MCSPWYSAGQYNQQSAALECLTIMNADPCINWQALRCLTIMEILWQFCRSNGHLFDTYKRPIGGLSKLALYGRFAIDPDKVTTLRAACQLQSRLAEHSGERALRACNDHKINLYNSYTCMCQGIMMSLSTCAIVSITMYAGFDIRKCCNSTSCRKVWECGKDNKPQQLAFSVKHKA